MSSRFWRHFASNGRASFVERHLGLFGTGVDLPEETLARCALNQPRGAKVQVVRQDSPADQAGIRKGDVLLQLAEQPVTNLVGLYRLLRRLPDGLPLAVTLLRDGRLLERWLILNDRPNPARRR